MSNPENKHWNHVDAAAKLLCYNHEDLSCPQYSSDFDDSYILLLDHGKTDRAVIVEEFRLSLSSLTSDTFELVDCPTSSYLLVNFY